MLHDSTYDKLHDFRMIISSNLFRIGSLLPEVTHLCHWQMGENEVLGDKRSVGAELRRGWTWTAVQKAISFTFLSFHSIT